MEEKITAWITRDKRFNLLNIHFVKPYKCKDIWINSKCHLTPILTTIKDNYPQVKWEDEEPTKVELTIKICE